MVKSGIIGSLVLQKCYLSQIVAPAGIAKHELPR